jgi:predicted dehydrogenase
MTYKIGVIGVGVYGCHSLEQALVQAGDAKIKTVCSNDMLGAGCHRDNLESAAKDYAASLDADFTDNWLDIVNDPEIDIVSVMACPAVKADIICAALEAGKQVVTDKPLGFDNADARRIVEAESKSSGKGFMLAGYHTRPMVANLIERIEAGQLGKIKAISMRLCFMGGIFPGFVPDAKWSGDIPSAELVTIGSHALITAMKIAGDKAVKVFAERKFNFYDSYHEVDAEDWSNFNLLFKSGCVANIQVGRIPHRIPSEDILLEVTGTEGYAEITSNCLNIYPGNEKISTPVDGGKVLNDTFVKFYECLENGSPMPTTFNEGGELQKIITAAITSDETGQVVDVV